jgi:hypothetical protein
VEGSNSSTLLTVPAIVRRVRDARLGERFTTSRYRSAVSAGLPNRPRIAASPEAAFTYEGIP